LDVDNVKSISNDCLNANNIAFAIEKHTDLSLNNAVEVSILKETWSRDMAYADDHAQREQNRYARTHNKRARDRHKLRKARAHAATCNNAVMYVMPEGANEITVAGETPEVCTNRQHESPIVDGFKHKATHARKVTENRKAVIKPKVAIVKRARVKMKVAFCYRRTRLNMIAAYKSRMFKFKYLTGNLKAVVKPKLAVVKRARVKMKVTVCYRRARLRLNMTAAYKSRMVKLSI
jgi:hypothetical protein